MTKQQQALSSAADDAAYILQPLIGTSVPGTALALAAERILRASLTDAGLPVTVKGGVVLRGTTVKAEAKRIADRLAKAA